MNHLSLRSRRFVGLSLTTFCLALFWSSIARGGLFIEPTAGYTMGIISQSNVPTIDTKTIIFGGRLGYRLGGLKFGLDYSMGIGTVEQFGNTGDYKPMDAGVFVGYHLPLRLSVYGTFFFFSRAQIFPTENPAYFSGQSFRLGLAFNLLSFCSIGFEGTYRLYSAYDGTALSKSLKGTTLGGSISFSLPSYE